MARLHTFSAVPVPPAEHPIAAATDQYRASRTPGHCIHDPRMPRQDPITCPPGRVALQASHIPHEQLLAVSPPLAPSARGEPLPVTTPRYAIEGSVGIVGFPHHPYTGSCGRVPYPDGIIPSTTRQPPPIGTPSYSKREEVMGMEQSG